MLKIGVVGDCSQGDPNLLAKALDAALAASDVVVQVGDINPGYQEIQSRLASGKLLCVPGNHDYDYPAGTTFFAQNPKQWRKDFPEATLIGLDNGQDSFGPGWDILDQYEQDKSRPPLLFLFMHKSLWPLVLPDGTESTHIMGEGSPNPEAQKLVTWLRSLMMVEERATTVCCGHYHGHSVLSTDYANVILEGRGGSGGYNTPWSPSGQTCGWTQIFVTPQGWTAHAIDLT